MQVREPAVEADVPFEFSIGKTTLPAGKYEIVKLDEADPPVLEILGQDVRKELLFTARLVQASRIATKSELVFYKYGDRYFLCQIWVAGEQNGNELEPLRTEQKVRGVSATSERRSIDAHKAQ